MLQNIPNQHAVFSTGFYHNIYLQNLNTLANLTDKRHRSWLGGSPVNFLAVPDSTCTSCRRLFDGTFKQRQSIFRECALMALYFSAAFQMVRCVSFWLKISSPNTTRSLSSSSLATTIEWVGNWCMLGNSAAWSVLCMCFCVLMC